MGLLCPDEVKDMSLGQKLKQLRKEKGWSQDELAYHADIDGRQLSRYENDKVVPSAEILVRIAQAYGVSVDYLLIDGAPRVALRQDDNELLELVRELEQLPSEDLHVIRKLIDAFLTKHKLRQLAAG